MKSDVYFSDLNVDSDTSRLKILDKLIRKSGLDRMDMEKKFVAIKMHFGEMGNLTYIRHNYVPVLANFIKEKGGVPFLIDCNTLYIGERRNAIDHLETATANGFSPLTTGCHVIIGDGLRGNDDVEVPINGEFVKNAKIGRGVYDADIIISLSHFKCHEMTGFGGAVKNLGMGCASRRGKMEQHSASKPDINIGMCKGCHACLDHCGSEAIYFENGKACIDVEKCTGCGICIGSCRFDAIIGPTDASVDIVSKKMAEYAAASVFNKPNFHISMITEVSPRCDCHRGNGLAVIPDVGFLASYDPVALDQACADLVNAQKINKGCVADIESDRDVFGKANSVTDWTVAMEHSEKIGLGVRSYNLIKI